MEGFARRGSTVQESKRSKENLFLADRNSLSKKQMYAVKKFQFEQKIETRCERGEKFLLNILFKKEINAVYALEYECTF